MKRVVLLLLAWLTTTVWAGYPEKDRVREAGAGQDILEQTPRGVVRMPVRSLDDEGGTAGSEWWYVGDTYYDFQSIGPVGQKIAVSSSGTIHFVWTKADDPNFFSRHSYYNCFDVNGDTLVSPIGIETMWTRSGYPDLELDAVSRAIIAGHAGIVDFPGSVLASNFTECYGDFWYSGMLPEDLAYWPHIALDRSGKIHLVATDADGGWNRRIHYVRGTPVYQDSVYYGVNFEQYDTVLASNCVFPTVETASSRISNRVVIAWVADMEPISEPENVMMRVSEDGGENWSDVISVTGLPPIDTMCVIHGGSPEECNGDTLRPWHDLSLIFDENDDLHIAFTASGFYYFNTEGVADPTRVIYSNIWHWGEETDDFSLIGEAWFGNDSVAMATNDLMCQKPSLAIDTTSGYLYCAYQQFDRHAYSAEGYPIGEFYMSVSTDNGRNWAVPTNVSNTPGVPNNPSGNDPSERDISLAKYVTNDQIHALYLHDYSAGSVPYEEGLTVQCSLVYLRIPTADITTTPLNPHRQFRDSTTAVGDVTELPSEFMLYPNYPNPFNPSTTLQFDLAKAGEVKLTVFDVLGNVVATLVDGSMSAGAHSVQFDGEKFASGVYFARLSVGEMSMTRKMALLK